MFQALTQLQSGWLGLTLILGILGFVCLMNLPTLTVMTKQLRAKKD